MVIRKGQVRDKFPLRIQEEVIPSPKKHLIKCLGKWFDASLKDHNNVNRLCQQVKDGMKTTDKTQLLGKHNAWMYQHGLLPRLIWPLTLYEIQKTAVAVLERTVSKYLRRWLGVPPSFTNIRLYGKTTKLQLPLSYVLEEFKVSKTRLVVTLKDSRDQLIRQAGIETRTGRKCSASQAVEQAETWLRHRDIIGTPFKGRMGTTSRANGRLQNHKNIGPWFNKKLKIWKEEFMKTKAVQMGKQASWTRWTTPERSLSLRLKFLLRSVYDVLPSPVNLCQWNLTDNPNCRLCEKRGTLDHILPSCKVWN